MFLCSMIWVDREVKKIKERKLKLEWVDDMKTPSGRIHVGSLRGVVIHDLIYKVLVENGIKAEFSYVFNDLDPMDAIPSYLEYSKWEKYAGQPLYKIPSPETGYKSFAEYYAKDFINVFESINCHPKIIWSSELYNSGKMNEVIKKILDNADKVREIYSRIAKASKPDDWFPLNVVCENCGKVGTTEVYKWDGEIVYYRCSPHAVAWAKGCGHEGKISPFNGNAKFPWKVDWAVTWKTVGITIEGAGKDHMSKGGSHDIASAICNEVLHYPIPYAVPYEWFTIGGKKMSSSKGIGTSANEVSKILPPDVFRFLIVRTPINTHLDFTPSGDTIPNLFDDYDRCLNAYFSKIENDVPEGKKGEVLEDFARIAELSAVKTLLKKRLFLPRFRTIANLVKTKADIFKFFKNQKGSKLNDEEKNILKERIAYAEIFLKNYAEKKEQETSACNKFISSKTQEKFLNDLANNLLNIKKMTKENIQENVFNTLKKGGYKPKDVFRAFYQILTGKDFGPKAADLIMEIGIKKAIDRLKK